MKTLAEICPWLDWPSVQNSIVAAAICGLFCMFVAFLAWLFRVSGPGKGKSAEEMECLRAMKEELVGLRVQVARLARDNAMRPVELRQLDMRLTQLRDDLRESRGLPRMTVPVDQGGPLPGSQMRARSHSF